MSIFISAIICTHNRADYLHKAIASLTEQTLDKEKYEILVVDNHSTDHTRQVVERFSIEPNLNYLYEPVLGLSQARNTGWQNACGKYVAYLDDDAIASPNWLKIIVEIFDTVESLLGCVGGKVEPIWEVPRPDWLSDILLPNVTVLDLSDEPKILEQDEMLVGANMAFPRRALEQVGGFDVNLGRVGTNLLSMEEIYLREKLEDLNYISFYHPDVSVYHHIPKNRLTQDWFFQRFYWQGISIAAAKLNDQKPSRYKRFVWVLQSVVKTFLKPHLWLSFFLPSDKNQKIFIYKCVLKSEMGYIAGLTTYSL